VARRALAANDTDRWVARVRATWLVPISAPFAALCALALLGSVVAAVHHAEVVATRVGEPFGTLVLAVAVTASKPAFWSL
jgi:Ca2+:H+ antiporter